MSEYDCMGSCNKCGGENKVDTVDTINGAICECKTKCKKCGFTDYWDYGYFESGSEMVSKCEKYSFDKQVDNETTKA